MNSGNHSIYCKRNIDGSTMTTYSSNWYKNCFKDLHLVFLPPLKVEIRIILNVPMQGMPSILIWNFNISSVSPNYVIQKGCFSILSCNMNWLVQIHDYPMIKKQEFFFWFVLKKIKCESNHISIKISNINPCTIEKKHISSIQGTTNSCPMQSCLVVVVNGMDVPIVL